PREQRDRNEMYLSVIPASDVIAAVKKMLPVSHVTTVEGDAL
ncbi:MAG: lipopolysaccharide core heptosyltransferase RfaQ, partial [Enterobacteriaceae bacterium]